MRITCLLLLLLLSPGAGRAGMICSLTMDADSGVVLDEQGDCDRRVTPASTFKLPLAVLAAEAGLIGGPGTPVLHPRKGDPDYGGPAWTGPVDPAIWMEQSVLWFSWRLAEGLGPDRLAEGVRRIEFGNADMTGDPGQGNGMTRAWIGSSLTISGREQARFLRRLLRGDLPVSPQAMERGSALLPVFVAGDWTIAGKTGSAFPRRPDGRPDRNRGWGWFVGWARHGDRRLILVRLWQDDRATPGSAGPRLRDRTLADWPAMAAGWRTGG